MRITIFLLIVLVLGSCSKEAFTGDPAARLQTLTDTLRFDTVFTTTGAVTRPVKLFNRNKEGLRIASVRLAGGNQSPFRINADGVPGPEIRDLEIAGGDSAYLFVTVRIEASSATLPFVVRDSIEIHYNGNTEKIRLEAFGQNARFLRGHTVTGAEQWDNTLPYVILDGLQIAKSGSLTIGRGTRVFLHANAPLIVEGSLQVMGTTADSSEVVFRSDRTDAPYRDYPAGWPGIVFRASSANNAITGARILNAYQAIVLEEDAAGPAPKLRLTQTVIDNAFDAGITAVRSSLVAENVLVSNCGKNVLISGGGDYLFTHCTLASIPNPFIQHKDPVLSLTNFTPSGNTVAGGPLSAVFRNCIIWGEGGLVDDEVAVARSGAAPFSVVFDHVLWKIKEPAPFVTVTGAISNQPPGFEQPVPGKEAYNFRLGSESPALGKGKAAGVPVDLEGRARSANAPDLGAYERP